MKKTLLLIFGLLMFSSFGENLLLNFSKDKTILKSQEIDYSGGQWKISLTGKPDWVDFVVFCYGGFERKINAGSSQMAWSSSVPQKCAFKAKVKANDTDAGRSWSFTVKDANDVIVWTVDIVQDAGVKMSKKVSAGTVEKTADGDLMFLFNRVGGVLKSLKSKYTAGELNFDTTSCPSWIQFIKICSVMGERKLPGANASGGKNVYTCSVNGAMDFSFKVMVAPNDSGSGREWVLPVTDDAGDLLFNLAISQCGQ